MNQDERPSDQEIFEIDNKKRAIPEPTPEDFRAIRDWGMIEDPFIALEDYSDLKMELRWLNKAQREALIRRYMYRETFARRGFQDYHKSQRRPISRNKWEFLKLRKSWFIVPLEWDRFAAPDCRGIIDVGCGDGDALQRVSDDIADRWQQTGHPGHDLRLVGIDISPTRIKNATAHYRSPHDNISTTFQTHDAVMDSLPFENNSFTFAVSTGVFGLLDEVQAQHMMSEICRVTEKGLYLQVLGEESPGAYLREDFSYLLEPHGFRVEKAFWVFTEPFVLEGSKDPLMSMPIIRTQVFFASRDS